MKAHRSKSNQKERAAASHSAISTNTGHPAIGDLRPSTTQLQRVQQAVDQRVNPQTALQKKLAPENTPSGIVLQGIFENIQPGEDSYNSDVVKTDFQTRVTIAPMDETDLSTSYGMEELWVKDVKMSNDRPPTKFGTAEGQRSHTVAWILVRKAVAHLRNQTLQSFLTVLRTMTNHSTPSQLLHSQDSATALKQKIVDGLAEIDYKKYAIEKWQMFASDLLTRFVHFYQLNEAAAYRDGQAEGHGESDKINSLQEAEETYIQDPAWKPDDDQLKVIRHAALGMLDVKKSIPVVTRVEILQHWLDMLGLAFPAIHSHLAFDLKKQFIHTHFENHDTLPTGIFQNPSTEALKNKLINTNTTKEIANKDIRVSADQPQNTKFSLGENASSFVSNVVLEDSGVDDISAVKIENIRITKLNTSNDRPKTRYGHLQKSHTVSWSLIRKHLSRFSGQALSNLVNFIQLEMGKLKNDINQNNPHIKFDASAIAQELEGEIQSLRNTTAPIYHWQESVSDMVESYITLYQLSNSATYGVEERPSYHGEGQALDTLEDIHDKVQNGDHLHYAANKATVTEKLKAFLDVNIGTSSLGPFERNRAIQHWMAVIKDTYPAFFENNRYDEELLGTLNVVEINEALVGPYVDSGTTLKDKLKTSILLNAQQDLKSYHTALITAVESLIVDQAENGVINEDTLAEKITEIRKIKEIQNPFIRNKPKNFDELSDHREAMIDHVANGCEIIFGSDDYRHLNLQGLFDHEKLTVGNYQLWMQEIDTDGFVVQEPPEKTKRSKVETGSKKIAKVSPNQKQSDETWYNDGLKDAFGKGEERALRKNLKKTFKLAYKAGFKKGMALKRVKGKSQLLNRDQVKLGNEQLLDLLKTMTTNQNDYGDDY